MDHEKRSIRDLAAYVICFAAALAAVALFLKYVLGILLPFLVAWGLALAVRPLAARVGRGTRIPESVLRLIILLLVFALLCFGIWVGGTRLLRELRQLWMRLSEEGTVEAIIGRVQSVIAKVPFLASGAGVRAEEFLNKTVSGLLELLPSLVGWMLSSVPRAMITAVIVLIASVYFCLDLEHIHGAIVNCLPERWRARMGKMRDGVLRVAATYVKAYLILMLLTAALLFVGLLIIGVDYALLLAFLISLVDLFPVLGVGTVLVPWSLWCLIIGEGGRATGLLILWGVVLIVRQFAEPRVLGGSLGVHPLLTLFAMYAGLHLAGVWGMLLFPALAVPPVAFFKRRRVDAEKG